MNSEYYQEYGWYLAEPDNARIGEISASLGVSDIIARLLLNRGVDSPEKASEFLFPRLEHLHDPLALPDMEKGARRIVAAIESKEKILVHGDYDIDGVSSTAVLVRTLEKLDANVDYKVPNRKTDGYDIKPAAVEKAHNNGTRLIVTCDCGTTAIQSADLAREYGIDLIVTDHHEPASVLPDVYALINPKRKDASYPFPELAGVGVALKTAQAIAHYMNHKPESVLKAYLDLAALGTVGDVAPLLGENRAIVRYGLAAMSESKKTGIRTAIGSTGYSDKTIDPYFIGFVLGPRLNAVGRLDDASVSLKLLLTRDESEARDIMNRLEEINRERRVIQDQMMREAEELVNSKDMTDLSVLVLASPGWNSGVVGIVAGRLCEKYGMPVILLSIDTKRGICHGSGRSVAGFHLKEAIDICRELVVRHGGHAGAVGVTVAIEQLAEFEAAINAIAKQVIPVELVGPRIDVDAELLTANVNREMAESVNNMQPFGCGNPEPIFASSGLVVTHSQVIGGDGTHLKMFFEGDDNRPLECVAFGWGKHKSLFEPGSVVDICYNLRINNFNGNSSVQMLAVDVRKAG